MTLLLDPGGTRLKWAFSEQARIVSAESAPWLDAMDSLVEAVQSMDSPLDAAVRLSRPWPPAATGMDDARLAGALGVPLHVLDPTDRVPFEVGYVSGKPGADRLAAARACHGRDAGGSFIIIDAGTCVTVDLLSPGQWRGGAILPGLALQSESMARAGLPVLQPDGQKWAWNPSPEGALGTHTMAALEAGIPRALRLAVEQTARDLMTLDPCAQVVLTGGDAAHFDGLGGWRTFADPNLVLTGTALLLNDPLE